MKDIDRLIARIWQFGGMRLVWQYAKMGVLWTSVKELLKCAAKKRSFKSVYPIITGRIDKLLAERYSYVKSEGKKIITESSDYVWFCWLQGVEHAPEMVRVCLEAQRRMFGDKIVVLGDKNYRDWVTLPDYVEEKYRRGHIPRALFSDLLRLELLIKYGGTWIDSTVLVNPTGLNELDALWKPSLDNIWHSDLFIFRYYQKGKVVGMSNWMIHAKAGNPLLMDLQEMLLAYWKDYSCTVEYYIFHLFFGVVAKRYPQMIAGMAKGNSRHSLLLRDFLAKDFDADWWKKMTEHVCFHKLNYRLEGKAKMNPNSFWNYILRTR